MAAERIVFYAGIACFAASGVFAVLAARAFFAWDVRRVMAELSGRATRGAWARGGSTAAGGGQEAQRAAGIRRRARRARLGPAPESDARDAVPSGSGSAADAQAAAMCWEGAASEDAALTVLDPRLGPSCSGERGSAEPRPMTGSEGEAYGMGEAGSEGEVGSEGEACTITIASPVPDGHAACELSRRSTAEGMGSEDVTAVPWDDAGAEVAQGAGGAVTLVGPASGGRAYIEQRG